MLQATVCGMSIATCNCHMQQLRGIEHLDTCEWRQPGGATCGLICCNSLHSCAANMYDHRLAAIHVQAHSHPKAIYFCHRCFRNS